ncbi:MAG: very short patch repair endonuclease [Calditrichaeota bacterium]|nr:MAG: very short patch repair endonuclease [Calditrichota bacterium]MBL1206495.1 very short patch repair endonuclease [Calditrichota bacterium]NOG46322.1 very short patch repair endonuclease [Calditrichota bacterium]
MVKYDDEEIIKVPRFKDVEGFYTTKERSELMSKIKGKNTKPELDFRKELWRRGIRYRINYKKLPGKPDIVSKKYKLIIFIDGEFWHGYNWNEKKQKIKSNRDFWIPKIERNMQRDRHNNETLKNMGYKVFRFWDFEIKKHLTECLEQVFDYLNEIEIKYKNN